MGAVPQLSPMGAPAPPPGMEGLGGGGGVTFGVGAPGAPPPGVIAPPGLGGGGILGGPPPPAAAAPMLWLPPPPEPVVMKLDPRLDPDNPIHKDYVDLIVQSDKHFKEQATTIWRKANDWWDLFLAIQEDKRDLVDESWRSNVFVPLPFSITRTKAAQTVELLGNTPNTVWQVQAAREEGTWYEESQHIERLLDYTARVNRWRKMLYKLATSRSVQGTTYLKVVHAKRSHVTTLTPGAEEYELFKEAVQNAINLGAPYPGHSEAEFEAWRNLVNTSKNYGPPIPTPPKSGPQEVVEYEGPVFQQIPLWSVRLDATIDEMENQPIIIHRTVKPRQYLLDRADNDPNSDKPFLLKNIEAAMASWNGQVLVTEERVLAESLGLNPEQENHPYYKDAVKLWEVWSPNEKFRYAIILNGTHVINKRPFENPLLTTCPNIFALRNVIVPGSAYGLSDYQEPNTLFTELNTFRRTRMDGAVLTTLPAFVKESGYQFTEAMKKIKPGMIISARTATSIQALIKHALPAEAYREPQEIKLEIEDATEVWSATKGAPATVGRVTGTEFQGRSAATTLKYKLDCSLLEEELAMLPAVTLSLIAQMGPARWRKEIGGDPDALVDVTRDKIIQSIGMRFRLRGATRNLSPDLQIQQLTTIMRQFQNDLTPVERRAALQVIMELLEVRGVSKILSMEGQQTIASTAALQTASADAGAAAQVKTAKAAAVPVPAKIGAKAAAELGGQGGKTQ